MMIGKEEIVGITTLSFDWIGSLIERTRDNLDLVIIVAVSYFFVGVLTGKWIWE